MHLDTQKVLYQPGSHKSIEEFNPADFLGYKNKSYGQGLLKVNRKKLQTLSDKLYAQGKHSILLIMQATDGAGKDSTVKHVLRDVRPQMTEMVDFKEPGREELAHTFLWKSFKMIPVRGKIGIFNRSYYEEIVTTRVHPELILNQNIPGINSVADITGEFWSERIFHINSFEKHLASEGYLVLKFFLNLSWSKQRDRFLRRIRKPEKHWKFSYKDIEERNFWNSYRSAYQKAVESTSTKYAPWYIIPADHKWVMRTAVSEILVKKMEELGLDYPVPDQETIQQMERAKNILKEG